jgi:hypothetical protein
MFAAVSSSKATEIRMNLLQNINCVFVARLSDFTNPYLNGYPIVCLYGLKVGLASETESLTSISLDATIDGQSVKADLTGVHTVTDAKGQKILRVDGGPEIMMLMNWNPAQEFLDTQQGRELNLSAAFAFRIRKDELMKATSFTLRVSSTTEVANMKFSYTELIRRLAEHDLVVQNF